MHDLALRADRGAHARAGTQSETVYGLGLCAGYGGLELGLHIALGDRYRTVAYVEREAYVAALLAARMAEGTLAPAPVWDDLVTFDGRPWRGLVDCVTAGFPCQPWSGAGKRRGTEDERWIWPDIVRILREVEPGWVFLENVPQLVAGGLEHVLRDLAAAGFDAEWDCVSAADVGASHLRERLFILAHRHEQRDDGSRRAGPDRGTESSDGGGSLADRDGGFGQPADGSLRTGRGTALGRGRPVAHRDGDGVGEGASPPPSGRSDPDGRRPSLADGGGPGWEDTVTAAGTSRGLSEPDGRRASLGDGHGARQPQPAGTSDGVGRWAGNRGASVADDHHAGWEERRAAEWVGPEHAAAERRGSALADADGVGWGTDQRDLPAGNDQPDPAGFGPGHRLPLFTPHRNDWDAWGATLEVRPDLEPTVLRVAHGVTHRNHRIRAAGNGVVPLAAAVAFLRLRARLTEGLT